MASRPYFKYGIEQLQELAQSSREDLKVLKAIQYELGFRRVPKARALKRNVDEQVNRLSPIGPAPNPPRPPVPHVPNRVIVECANCKTPNFVSTLEDVVQHLSCSACKAPYEAQFKYGVMRTKFQTTPVLKSGTSAYKWIVAGIFLLIVLILLLK